jgi:hypothetical protein
VITKVVYARLFNLGNYENERIEVEAVIGADENPGAIFEELRKAADQQHEEFQAARVREQEERDRKYREEYEARRQAAKQPAIVDKAPDDIF